MPEASAGVAGEGQTLERTVSQVKPIECIPLHLKDTYALEKASSPRKPDDYSTENLRRNLYTLPPIISRELLVPVPCMQNMQETAQREGIDDLKMLIVRHNLPLPDGAIYPAPVDTVASYTYHDTEGHATKVDGRPMLSTLHRLVASELTSEQRIQVIQHHFGTYLRQMPDHEVTVIAIPAKGEDSPTHRAFADLAVPHPGTGKIVELVHNAEGKHTENLYYFPHGVGQIRDENIAKAQRLMTDTNFRNVSDAIHSTWKNNFRSDVVQNAPDNEELANKQNAEMNTILIENWKQQPQTQK